MLWTLLLLIDHQFICDSVCSIANATKDHYCIVGIERLVLMDTIGGRHFSCGITRRMEVSLSFYGYFFRRTVCQKCNFGPNIKKNKTENESQCWRRVSDDKRDKNDKKNDIKWQKWQKRQKWHG